MKQRIITLVLVALVIGVLVFVNGIQQEKDQLRSDEEMEEIQERISLDDPYPGYKEGEAYLEEIAQGEGVVTLPSGLIYKVLEEGDGKSPRRADDVLVHYTGTLYDGTQFDSSRDRGAPTELNLNRVIPGWQEGMQLMKEGSRWMLYVPYQLGYGAGGRPPKIPQYAALTFDIELIEVL